MNRVVLLLCLTACTTEYAVTNAPPTMFPGGFQVHDPTRPGLGGELSEPESETEIAADDPEQDDPPLGDPPLDSAVTPPERPGEEAGFLSDAAEPDGDEDLLDEEPVADDSEEPAGEPPFGEDPLGEDPVEEGPRGEDPLGEDPLGEEPPAEDPLGEEPPGEDPLGEDPLGEDPLGEDPLGEEPPAEEPPVEDPLGEDPPVEEPPVGTGGMTPGRMTGQVGLIGGGKVHALVYCDVTWVPEFSIDVHEGEFVLATLDVVSCWDDPGFDSDSNQTEFDTLIGEGTGTLGGAPATVWFSVSDGGESGDDDHVAFEITVGGVVIAADSDARNGNLQAHPPIGGVP